MKSCSRMFEPLWTVEPLNQCARVPRRSSVGAFQRVESGEQLSYERRFEQVIGNSPALEEVLEQVERVAPGFHRSYPGRNRHRQGADRARDSQHQLALRTSLRKVELRCYSAGSAGK